MKTDDHLLLGKYLLKMKKLSLSPQKEKWFLIGCVEPDYNPFTYIRGSFKYKFLHGHNALNCMKHINKIVDKLSKFVVSTPYQWFLLGTAVHYIADCFTFAHNEFFYGDMSQHMKYERLLQPIFHNYIDGLTEPQNKYKTYCFNLSFYHNKYQNENRSYLTDCEYIVSSTEKLLDSLELAKDEVPLMGEHLMTSQYKKIRSEIR